MLQLSEIYIYPVKSLGGISLSKAQVTDRGLAHDRRWMLVDENGRFLSQREFPQLAIFQTSFEGNSLKITDKGNGHHVIFDINEYQSDAMTVQVWDDTLQAFEVNPTTSHWFSEALGIPVKLVYMPDNIHRKTDGAYALTGEEITSFSDGYPILIIGQSSLNSLNERLAEPVGINRFRPNFVFTGGEAFEEDEWHEFHVGQVRFFGVKPCARCIMTTIDPETGNKNNKEPLLTLNKYRKAGNKILFGQNVLISQLGEVSVGDSISVLSRKKLEKFNID